MDERDNSDIEQSIRRELGLPLGKEGRMPTYYPGERWQAPLDVAQKPYESAIADPNWKEGDSYGFQPPPKEVIDQQNEASFGTASPELIGLVQAVSNGASVADAGYKMIMQNPAMIKSIIEKSGQNLLSAMETHSLDKNKLMNFVTFMKTIRERGADLSGITVDAATELGDSNMVTVDQLMAKLQGAGGRIQKDKETV